MHHQNLLRFERNRTQLTLERFVVVVFRINMSLQIIQMHKRLHTVIALVDLRPGRSGLTLLDLLQQLPVQRILIDPVRYDRRCGGCVFHDTMIRGGSRHRRCRRRNDDRCYVADGTAVEAGFSLLSTDLLFFEAGQVLLRSLLGAAGRCFR